MFDPNFFDPAFFQTEAPEPYHRRRLMIHADGSRMGYRRRRRSRKRRR